MNRYYGSDSEDPTIINKYNQKRKHRIIKNLLEEAKHREKKAKELKTENKEITNGLDESSKEILETEIESLKKTEIEKCEFSDSEPKQKKHKLAIENAIQQLNEDFTEKVSKELPLTHSLKTKWKRSKVKKNNADKQNKKELGYTVIGEKELPKKHAIERILPDWLSNPVMLNHDLHEKKLSIEECDKLDKNIIKKVKQSGIASFFPVQQAVVPWLISVNLKRWNYRPEDLCVSAPTGSGKTLAFVLPIIQSLKERIVTSVRCLVVLPVRDLANQVYSVFYNYCNGTSLNVVQITGYKSFAEEQKCLVKEGLRGFLCLADIVIATPGRLIDHIHKTGGFCLTELKFLVIDEADRMMDEIQQGWLNEIEKAVYKGKSQKMGCCCREQLFSKVNSSLTPCVFGHISDPLQKLLYSATLSQDSEKIQQLSLFCPKLFKSTHKLNYDKTMKEKSEKNIQKAVIEYNIPSELKEYFSLCKSSMKPLLVWYLVKCKKFSKVLCFTNSVESSHRLYLVLKNIGEFSIAEFSSKISGSKKKQIFNSFASGKITVLVCSDMMARGIDIEDIDCVLLYDVPKYFKTYVHRVGRTARAGKEGTAITLLEKSEERDFLSMRDLFYRQNLSNLEIKEIELEPYQEKYKEALEKTAHLIAVENKLQNHLKYSLKKKPIKNKFRFVKRKKRKRNQKMHSKN